MQTYLPLVLLVSSAIILLLPLRRQLYFLSRRRHGQSIPFGGLDNLRESENSDNISTFENDGDDFDTPIYRLNTNEPDDNDGTDDAELVLHIDAENPIAPQIDTEGEVVDDDKREVEIVFLRPRGTRARAAFEQSLLFLLIALHTIIFIVLVVYTPAETPVNLKFIQILTVAYWVYATVLAVCKSARFLTDVPPSFWMHGIVLYFTQWLISIVGVFSLVGETPVLLKIVTYMDCLLCTALWGLALASPLRRIPAYIETAPNSQPNPEAYVSLFSILTMAWMYPLLTTGLKRRIAMSDIWDIPSVVRVKVLVREFAQLGNRGSLVRKLASFIYVDLLFSWLWTTLETFGAFYPALMIKSILSLMESPEPIPLHIKGMLTFALFFLPLFRSAAGLRSNWGFRLLSMRVRQLLCGEIYNKALYRKIGAFKSKQNDADKPELGEDEEEGEEAEAKRDVTNGRIINLMALDSTMVSDALQYAKQLVKVVMILITATVLLFLTIGSTAFVTIGTIFSIVPANYYLGKLFHLTQRLLMKANDERIEKTNEVLQSIKIIKYFGRYYLLDVMTNNTDCILLAWESRFASSIGKIREKELKKVLLKYYLWSTAGKYYHISSHRLTLNRYISGVTFYGFTPIVTLTTFGYYTMIAKKELTATVAFTTIALVTQLQAPMDILIDVLVQVVQCRVSLGRVSRFLLEPGTDKYSQLKSPTSPDHPTIGFVNATLSWGNGEEESDFKLKDLNLDFKVGDLSVIIGPTGCGKTSLLMALLGEMTLMEGEVYLPHREGLSRPRVDPSTGFAESIAYCAQQPWLRNDSIKNNILFDSPYDERRYRACVHACALLRDFEILEYGDQTPIGEKGIAMSGGQKQRIALARALYSPARHLVLDDCLSAVDSHSAQWIYEKCILGPMMQSRTCILVSHNVALTLMGADFVVVMDTGAVKVSGSPQEVYASGALGSDEALQQTISENTSRATSRAASRATSSANLVEIAQRAAPSTAAAENDPASDPLIFEEPANVPEEEALEDQMLLKSIQAPPQDEDQEQGSVSRDIYKLYLRAMGTWKFWSAVLLIHLGQQLSQLGQTYWLRQWTNQLPSEKTEDVRATRTGSNGYSPGRFVLVYGLIALSYIFFSTVRPLVVFTGGVHASRQIFNSLLNSILHAVPRFFDVTPVGRILNRFSNDVERLDNGVGPSVYGIVYTTMTLFFVVSTISILFPPLLIGVAVIAAAYGTMAVLYLATGREVKRHNSTNRSPVFQHFGETLAGLSTIRAFGYEKAFLNKNEDVLDYYMRAHYVFYGISNWLFYYADLIGGMLLAIVGTYLLLFQARSIDPGLAGLCLTYATNFSGVATWFVNAYGNIEMDMNSVERINSYLKTEQEAAEIIEDNRPPENWPDKGAIEVENLSLRYAPELPKVIDGVSFNIQPRWKVGVVGRTGAGKSTIAAAFFRFLEADTGRISIDGIDIAKIGLKDLRSGLTIIPQGECRNS